MKRIAFVYVPNHTEVSWRGTAYIFSFTIYVVLAFVFRKFNNKKAGILSEKAKNAYLCLWVYAFLKHWQGKMRINFGA